MAGIYAVEESYGHKKRGDSNNHPKIMRMKPGFIFACACSNIEIILHNRNYGSANVHQSDD